jgi:hypothetical protein
MAVRESRKDTASARRGMGPENRREGNPESRRYSMKIKKFILDHGKYVVVASYTTINDTTKAEDDTTLKTNEGPEPKLRDAWANLSLAVREYWGLSTLKLRIFSISFTENKDGHGATFKLESVGDEQQLSVGPLKIKREIETLAGTNDKDPDSLKNNVLDALDLVENKITEYINGAREQPKLPEVEPAQIEARPQGRFNFVKEQIQKAGKRIAGGAKATGPVTAGAPAGAQA